MKGSYGSYLSYFRPALDLVAMSKKSNLPAVIRAKPVGKALKAMREDAGIVPVRNMVIVLTGLMKEQAERQAVLERKLDRMIDQMLASTGPAAGYFNQVQAHQRVRGRVRDDD